MKTTTKRSAKTVGTAAEWESIWTAYMTAVRAGEDLTTHHAEVRRYHEAAGWPVPVWAR
jgi:hypothetical protein